MCGTEDTCMYYFLKIQKSSVFSKKKENNYLKMVNGDNYQYVKLCDFYIIMCQWIMRTNGWQNQSNQANNDFIGLNIGQPTNWHTNRVNWIEL